MAGGKENVAGMVGALGGEQTGTGWHLEIEAVSKALAILSSDDAHDLFTKTLGCIQKESSVQSQRRQAVTQVLSSAHNPKLSALSTTVQLAQFEKVKETLDNIITDLTQEKEDEIELRVSE